MGNGKTPGCFTGMLGMKAYLVMWGLYPAIKQPGFNGKVRNQTNNGLRDDPCKGFFPTKYQWARFGLWTSYTGIDCIQEAARDLNSHGQEDALNKTLLRF